MDRARRWQWLGVWTGGSVFALVALDFLAGGPVSGLDQAVYDRITAWQAAGWPLHWWAEAATKAASPPYASAITLFVVAWWWLQGQRRLAAWGAGGSLAVALAITILKQGFRRELPPLAAGAWYGYAFPSGHTIGAAANLGLLVLLAAQRRIDRRGLRGEQAHHAWTAAVASWALLTVVVGIGRVLTQRHWASDVLASWGLGTALACATLLLARVPSSPAAVPGASSAGPHFAERAT